MFQFLNFAGRAVAGQHDLLVRLVQRVEGVEKFLLNAFLAGQKLDVVNQQHVGLAVFACGIRTSWLFWMASMYSLVNFSDER